MKHLSFMPAVRLLACLALPLCLAAPIAAQTEASSPPVAPDVPLDDFTTRSVVAEHAVLAYPPVRESDILFEKRLWRVIDVREKMNQAFSYPVAPLAQILGEAALSGTLTVYDAEDDRFSQPLKRDAVYSTLFRGDTLSTVDVETGEETVRIVYNTPDWTAVKRFRLKEAWYFDTRTSTLRFRILGIAPLINVVNSEGDFLYERPLFWVHYPSARPFLAREKVYAPGGNLSATMTWEDLFETRMFASTVYKESNPYDRRLQDYLAGTDLLYEADRINDALFNREHDLWSW